MPQDFTSQSGAFAPQGTFIPKAAQLPPGHPQRTAAINRIIDKSFTAPPAMAARLAAQLKALNLSPDEMRYVSVESAKRGDQAISAKAHADVHDLTHTVLPALANVPLGFVGTDVAHVKAAVEHPVARLEDKGAFAPTSYTTIDGKRVPINSGVDVPFLGGAGALEEAGNAAKAVEHVPRTMSLGKHTTQLPLSPAHVTAWAQRHLDRISEGLTAPANRLSESTNPFARAAGAVVTKASARARVPIQAGKNLKQEIERAGALRATEVKALKPGVLPGSEGSQLAHFWWAQLPAKYRNAEGLRLVRDKLIAERDGIQGATDAELQARLNALDRQYQDVVDSAMGGKPGDYKRVTAIQNRDAAKLARRGVREATVKQQLQSEAEKFVQQVVERHPDHPAVQALKAKLAEADSIRAELARRADVSLGEPTDTLLSGAGMGARDVARRRALDANIAKLERVIKKTPAFDQGSIDALAALNRDREEILHAAGKLDPEVAAERRGLVSRWLGLEPTGEEQYIGHRLTERPSGGVGPKSIGLGKARAPKGVGQQNELRLVRAGLAEQSLRVPVRDWQAAQSYHFHNTAKDELAAMGEPIGPEGPKPGYAVVNPRGHTLPRIWKTDEHARAVAEGYHPDEVQLHDLEDYVRNYLAEGPDRERLIAAAQKGGHAADLRQVPADVVRRYTSQVLPYKVIKGTQQGALKGVRSASAKAADLGHDLLYVSLIYSNPHYIPLITTQNLIMAGLQQGAFLPVNLLRAGQLIFRGPRSLKKLIDAEVVFGASKAIESHGAYPGAKYMRGAVRGITALHDDFPRISAFVHEAARLGVISKASPVLSEKDYAALRDLLTNPAKRPLLNDIRDRANQALVDFNRLGAKERYTAKRIGFVWAWTRGATRYPFRFALDHPLRSIALAYAALDAPGMPANIRDEIRRYNPVDHLAKGGPSWLQDAISLGNTKVAGHAYPEVLPLRSLSPVSTALDLYRTAGEAVTGSHATGHSLAGMLNPAIPAAVTVAEQKTPFGQNTSTLDALKQQAEQMTPLRGAVSDLISPPTNTGTRMYPSDSSRVDRLIRAIGGPTAVNPEAEYKARLREGDVSQAEKDQHTHQLAQAKLDQQMQTLGVPPAWVPIYRRAEQVTVERDLAKAAARRALPKGHTSLPAAVSYRVTMDTLHKAGMMDDGQYHAAIAAAAQMTNRQLRHWETAAWDDLGPGKLLAQLHHFYNVKTDKG